MALFDLENQWVFITTNVVAWVVIWSVFELILFDGGLLEAVIPAVVGGLTSGFVLFNLQQNTEK
ncbi:hypothetical protein [Halorubrum sp. FL23]|uniref:hypothetical protein n=1 Tax=Halorubrum sp. FL23 TaxID=3458704 RepID=UPI0040338931